MSLRIYILIFCLAMLLTLTGCVPCNIAAMNRPFVKLAMKTVEVAGMKQPWE